MNHDAADRICGNCAYWNEAAGISVPVPGPSGINAAAISARDALKASAPAPSARLTNSPAADAPWPAVRRKTRAIIYGRCENHNVILLDMRDALALTNADANCDDCGEGFSPSEKFLRAKASERYCRPSYADSCARAGIPPRFPRW